MLAFISVLLTLWPVQSLAVEQGIPPQDLKREWAEVPYEARVVALTALSQVGKPYRYATSDPDVGFDCSGLVKYAASFAGVDLPHYSRAQKDALTPVDEPQVGDLIWYPGHVAIYLGQGLEVHAPQPGKTVEVRPIPTNRRLEFRRIVETLPETVMLGHAAKSGTGALSSGVRYL